MNCSPPVSQVHGIPRQEYCSGSHSLLQGIVPTQGLNPGLLHCRQIHYYLSHQGSPSPFINCMVFKKYLSNNSFTFWIVDSYQINDLQVFFSHSLCCLFKNHLYDIVKSGFKFTAKLRGRYGSFPNVPCPHTCIDSMTIINTLHQSDR